MLYRELCANEGGRKKHSGAAPASWTDSTGNWRLRTGRQTSTWIFWRTISGTPRTSRTCIQTCSWGPWTESGRVTEKLKRSIQKSIEILAPSPPFAGSIRHHRGSQVDLDTVIRGSGQFSDSIVRYDGVAHGTCGRPPPRGLRKLIGNAMKYRGAGHHPDRRRTKPSGRERPGRPGRREGCDLPGTAEETGRRRRARAVPRADPRQALRGRDLGRRPGAWPAGGGGGVPVHAPAGRSSLGVKGCSGHSRVARQHFLQYLSFHRESVKQ